MVNRTPSRLFVARTAAFLLSVLFFFSAVFAGALDLQRGKIKMTIYDRNGKFSLFFSQEISDPFYIPLFVSEDPTTSRVSIMVDDKVTVLGDDSDFKPALETTGTGAKITWTGRNLKVVQAFDFITSSQSLVVDGVQITFSLISQKTEGQTKVGLKFLLDTNLGEKKDHFILPNGDKVTSELQFEGGAVPDQWISPSSQDKSEMGLLFMLANGATKPSRVFFGNWRRIKDASWEVSYRQGRDFNLMPYSFNDSAACMFYEGIVLDPGQSKDVVLLFGDRTSSTMAGARIGTTNALSDILEGTRTLSGQDLKEYIKNDSEVVEDLIRRIDEGMINIQSLSEDDLKILQAIFNELEQRKKIYQ